MAMRIPSLLALACGAAACADGDGPSNLMAPDAEYAVHGAPTSSVQTLLALDVGPVAIAHRGMGANLGEDPARPIENTVEAVRLGFEAGASVVEVDLQMTADGEIVALHDDFLDDFTCVNSLTREELDVRAPHIPSLQAVLQIARRYNRAGEGAPAGLLTVDLKPASPLCDPDDQTGPGFVTRVIEVIRRMGAADLVYFNSMSPVLLGIAAAEAPEIERQLTVLFLQLLSPEQVEAALGLPVVLIDKSPDYGLRWAEIGSVFRLPGYTSPGQAIATAFATGSRIISYDLQLLGYLEQSQPGSASALVRGTQAAGLHVFAGDVSEADEWHFGALLGVEALYADDVPLAISLQPSLTGS